MLPHFKYQYRSLYAFKMLYAYMYFPPCFLHLCILSCLVLCGFFFVVVWRVLIVGFYCFVRFSSVFHFSKSAGR